MLLLLLLCAVGCGVNQQKAKGIFKSYIGNNIPVSIKFIDLKMSNILGANATLIFTVSRSDFNSLLQGYKKVDVSNALVSSRDWLNSDIVNGKDIEAHYKHIEEENGKRVFYLFWNNDNGRVYFQTFIY